MPKNIMKIDLRFLHYSEKLARAYSTIAQNSTLWKSTLSLESYLLITVLKEMITFFLGYIFSDSHLKIKTLH